MQQRRRPQKLERAQAGVTQHVDQRNVVKNVDPDLGDNPDFGDDDADLRQRGERQGAFDVGLHAAGKGGEQGGDCSDRRYGGTSQKDSSRMGLTRSSKNAPRWTDKAP